MLFRSVSTAGAADLNQDGCVDSFYDATGACVSTTAATAAGLSAASGVQVAAFADVGPDVPLGQGVTIAPRSIILGRVGQPGPSNIGANSIVGRSATIGADSQIGEDVSIGRTWPAPTRSRQARATQGPQSAYTVTKGRKHPSPPEVNLSAPRGAYRHGLAPASPSIESLTPYAHRAKNMVFGPPRPRHAGGRRPQTTSMWVMSTTASV